MNHPSYDPMDNVHHDAIAEERKKKRPRLVLSGELGDGHQGLTLSMDDAGLRALRDSIVAWRDEFSDYDPVAGGGFEITVHWMSDREMEELPEL